MSAEEIARLSVLEIQDALGLGSGSPLLRACVGALARRPSERLGEALAWFDARIASAGVALAARELLASLGARVDVAGSPPAGPALVVTNHPGAYDALALMVAVGRDDVGFVAADRTFLRAMPSLSEHLVLVVDLAREAPDHGARVHERARGLRQALRWLERGGVLVQFGAGAIEPDARFVSPGAPLLGAWATGTGVLAKLAIQVGAAVVPAFTAGVHSPRAKRLPFVRWAERRGVTTIAPLVQATVPGFRDVEVSVILGAPVHADVLRGAGAVAGTEIIRERVAALARDACVQRT